MSDENASDRLDQRLDAFEQDTGIWPPGRDQAPEMAVGESKEDMRWRAWEYWQKATRQLAAKDAEIVRLRGAIATPEICAGVVSEVVERERDEARAASAAVGNDPCHR